ncbi:hypothetical protein B0H10DRAFT_2122883, partial [Mycena sp. CBHHK59/15]
ALIYQLWNFLIQFAIFCRISALLPIPRISLTSEPSGSRTSRNTRLSDAEAPHFELRNISIFILKQGRIRVASGRMFK